MLHTHEVTGSSPVRPTIPASIRRHVNQAARIEPIALPGCVYVSETVAALLSFGHEDFDFEYVGYVELAKGFGSFPIYLLQRPGYVDYCPTANQLSACSNDRRT